ncbi:MAG TPA: copper homeostasis protein CutC [Gemmatimonadaceae bacterium]|nr:copper homeostasis protein CutC [Gemmatimonadaceae bacterium]
MLVEAAIDTLDDAARSVAEGARRLEVCASLDVGGLTPSLELLHGCLQLSVPCVAMVRPRAGSYMLDDGEFERLCADASEMLSGGAHGVVFGMLRDDRTIDADDVRTVVRIAENAETIFHRAFDDTPDAFAALETLIECGVTRVLTSGHSKTAIEGADEIRRLVTHANGRIEILPGGGVRAPHARELVARTGVTQLHARGTPRVVADLLAV